MYLLAISLTFLEIAIFSLAVFAFLLAIRFFIASQKRLQHLLPQTKKTKSNFPVGVDRDGFIVPAGKELAKRAAARSYQSFVEEDETKNELKELRGMLQLQQLELSRAIDQISKINTDKNKHDDDERYDDVEHYDDDEEIKYNSTTSPQIEIEELQLRLENREAELKDLRQQTELAGKLHGHFEDVQSGYEELQLKVQKMEQQAWQAAELSIKVDSLQQSNEQLEKTVLKKEERSRELTLENGRLHEVLNVTEDKLSEANLQRQQLIKKVQFLEEINSDIQQMSEANRKLKNELRRVAELESMLNLITEERDALLHRRVTRF
ncbi:MAG: hypothetical protein M3Y85_06370 [Bacteroidota bacterium]|nr:hypothetical protein [Bacteroidota bacterium]